MTERCEEGEERDELAEKIARVVCGILAGTEIVTVQGIDEYDDKAYITTFSVGN